jgi:hypothetical protein
VTALVRLRLANAQRHVELDPAGHRLPDSEAVRRHFAGRLGHTDGNQALIQAAELGCDLVGMVGVVIAPADAGFSERGVLLSKELDLEIPASSQRGAPI